MPNNSDATTGSDAMQDKITKPTDKSNYRVSFITTDELYHELPIIGWQRLLTYTLNLTCDENVKSFHVKKLPALPVD